jgi:pseudouridine-5'-monophosphatase
MHAAMLHSELSCPSQPIVIWVPDANLLEVKQDGQYTADQILRSLEEFKPEEWGLPPYES